MKPIHIKEIESAVNLLESPGFIAKVTNLLGSPVEWVMEKLPTIARTTITKAVDVFIHIALKIAILTMSSGKSSPSPWWHRLSVGISGAVGGFFGLPALTYELPVSTTIMLRAIADIPEVKERK